MRHCLLAGLIAASCVGEVQPPGARTPPTTAPEPSAGPGPATETTGQPLPTAPVLRRLNRVQYDNTVADLLGDRSAPASDFPEDATLLGFDNNGTALTVPPLLAERMLLASERLAASAAGRLKDLHPCAAAAAPDEACAQQLITAFGQRAWRRPLTTAEVTEVMGAFRSGRERNGFKGGVELVLRTLLMAPDFLFLVEIGRPDPSRPDRLKLSPWEVASRLSYFLWQSMPDEALFAAARAGTLDTPAAVAAQAERMLDDPRAKKSVLRFMQQWLRVGPLASGLAKDQKMFPTWKPELAEPMQTELNLFLDDVFWKAPRPLEALFTADHTFVNKTLGAFYGVAGATDAAFVRVTLGERRAGVLTRGGLLATLAHHNQSSPTLRGVFVREQLLCETLPPPPPSANNSPSDPNATQTTRERLAQHAADASCAGCHKLIDPIGLAFENFDGVGLWRDRESGKLIDASGEIAVSGPRATFTGTTALARTLAGSDELRTCVAKQWLRFAYGRAEGPQDQVIITALTNELRASGDLRRLLVGLAATPAFLERGMTGGVR